MRDIHLIDKIARRAVALAQEYDVDYDVLTAVLDLHAANIDIPLDLERLLTADKGIFGHDVFGIRRHMNRHTAKLEGCFVPRCALPVGRG